MNELISNSINSQVFIDHEKRVGRKGMLSLINQNKGSYSNVWAVSNSKVLSLFNSENYLNIIKIFRNSAIKIIDFLYSPCFFIANKNIKKEKKTLLCAVNYREKEFWINSIKYQMEQYK
jgi:hypothetical protein